MKNIKCKLIKFIFNKYVTCFNMKEWFVSLRENLLAQNGQKIEC